MVKSSDGMEVLRKWGCPHTWRIEGERMRRMVKSSDGMEVLRKWGCPHTWRIEGERMRRMVKSSDGMEVLRKCGYGWKDGVLSHALDVWIVGNYSLYLSFV